MFSLLPRAFFEKVTQISPEWLRSRGISLLLADFDNTLLPYTSSEPGRELLDWLDSLRGAGTAFAVVSNSKKERVPEFCARYGIECVVRAKKPSARGVREALSRFGAKPEETALVGDQIFTDTLAANRGGVLPILVEPIHLSNLLLALRRGVESPIIFYAKRKYGYEK